MARIWACADILSARGPARRGRVTPTAAYKARSAADARPCPSRHGRGRSPAAAGGGSGRCSRLAFPVGRGAGNSPRAGPGAAASRPHTLPYSRSLPRPPRARAGGNGSPRSHALRSFVRSATSARTGLGARPLATACAARPVTHRGETPHWAAGLGPWGVLIGQEGSRGRSDVMISGSAAAPGGAGVLSGPRSAAWGQFPFRDSSLLD